MPDPTFRMKNLFHSIIHLLYPRLCVVCRTALTAGENHICAGCMADFPFSNGFYTPHRFLLEKFPDALPQNLYTLFHYDKYSNYRNLIYAIKYKHKKELGVYLGQMLGDRINDEGGNTGIDAIVPIPLHPKKESKRGYNQSVLIAEGIASVLQVEIYDHVIVRTQNNPSQTGKTPEERAQNTEGIFKVTHPEAITNKHLLIVDDVITTGSTIRSCLKTLNETPDVKFSLGCLATTIE